MNDMKDTVVALSTPAGRGAIAIIRMTGAHSEEILLRAFRPLSGGALTPRMLTLGDFDADGATDRVMAVVFRAPHSYTGEDMAEVHCHGSPEIAERVIRALVQRGATPAEPGEFTKRAFLHGKLTLDEAEAVGDLINARSGAQINAAYLAMRGGVNAATDGIYRRLLSVVGAFEAAIDYPEEDVEEQTEEEARDALESARDELAALAETYGRGAKVRGGVRVAIIGVPNAGKSSLLNSLLGRRRAIVTPNAGTTRDTIEESYEYKGVLFTLVDTAGLRDAEDEAEREGVERSADAARTAHVVLRVTDLTAPERADAEVTGRVIEVYNKTDIAAGDVPEGGVAVSALTGEGVEALKEEIYKAAMGADTSGTVLTTARHYSLVLEALADIRETLDAMGSVSLDCLLVPLRAAADALGRISGASATEDVINEIFSKFCVGK